MDQRLQLRGRLEVSALIVEVRVRKKRNDVSEAAREVEHIVGQQNEGCDCRTRKQHREQRRQDAAGASLVEFCE